MDAMLRQTIDRIPRQLVYQMGGYDTYTSCYVVQFGHIQAEFIAPDAFPNRIGHAFLRQNDGLPQLNDQQALEVAAGKEIRRLVIGQDARALPDRLGGGALEEVVLPDGIAIGPDTFAGSRGLRKVWFLGLHNRLAEGAFARLDVVFYCRADSDAARYALARQIPIVALQP